MVERLFGNQHPGDPRMTPRGRIVRAAEVGLWQDAVAHLEAARKRSREMVEAAQAEAQRLIAAGRKAGEDAAAAAVTAQLADGMRRIEAAWAGLEDDMIQIVAETVERVVGTLNPREATLAAACLALRELRHARRIEVRVPMADIAWIEAGLARNLEPQLLALVVLRADPDMATGRCLVSSEFGAVEAGLEAQLAALRAGLTGGLREGRHD